MSNDHLKYPFILFKHKTNLDTMTNENFTKKVLDKGSIGSGML